MKMYITQLRGVFERISQENEEGLEEAGRRLAQTLTMNGHVYVWGLGQGRLAVNEATESTNKLPGVKILFDQNGQKNKLTDHDSVLLFVAEGQENPAVKLIDSLKDSGAQFIGVIPSNVEGDLLNPSFDHHLFFPSAGPLIPLDDDLKRGNPESLAILFLYHLIYFSLIEILNEQDLLDDELKT